MKSTSDPVAAAMKAIRVAQFGGPDVLQLEEVPTPRPGPGQVLVKLQAIGVNPVETYQRSGTNPALPLPWTPGKDGAGVIESLGDGVEHWKRGERVYLSDAITGTYAEFAVCDAATVHGLPAVVSFQQGAAVAIPYATAHRALFHRARAVAGETVFIHGASGGVGIAATQFSRIIGLTILASAGTDAGRALAADHGAHHVFDHGAPDYLEKVMAQTRGRGVDIILEMLANVNLGKVLPVLSKQGRVIVVGSRGKVEITPRDLMNRDADVRGMMLFLATCEELTGIHAAIGVGLANGTLRPVVGREYRLADAARAHAAVLEPGAHGKIVLIP